MESIVKCYEGHWHPETFFRERKDTNSGITVVRDCPTLNKRGP